MLVLDENLPAGQRQLLRKWRMRFRVIGIDLARRGTSDENLIPLLHHLPQPTFFSLDRAFFRPELLHANYGLVWLDVGDNLAAESIRNFLRQHEFDTRAKRMRIVARVHGGGVTFWRMPKRSPRTVSWPP